jgi:hypothetical protein
VTLSPVAQEQQLSGGAVVEGLEKLKVTALLHVFIAMLVGVSALLLLALTPFSTIRTSESLAGLASLIVTVAFTVTTVYGYLLPSANRFARWKPRDFLAPLVLMRSGYTGGALITLGALLALTWLVRETASGFIVAGTVISIEEVIYIYLILLLVGGILLFTGYTGTLVYLYKLSEAFNSLQLSRAGAFVVIFGTAFILLSSALLIIHSTSRATSNVAVNATMALLIITLLISLLGIVTWAQVYSEASSIERKTEAGTIQA